MYQETLREYTGIIKISELIQILSSALQEYGDLEITLYDDLYGEYGAGGIRWLKAWTKEEEKRATVKLPKDDLAWRNRIQIT